MPKSERDETLSALTSRIFSAMLDDLVLDATLQSHHEVARSRTVCRVCGTRCGSVHTPASLASASQAPPSSRADTPSSTGEGKAAPNGNSGTGASTPTSVKDGNLYLECVSCSRQIASNRYAPHLSSCLGLNSSRRGPVRGNVKAKQPSDAGRSASPTSEQGNGSDEKSTTTATTTTKGKGKAKAKRAEEPASNLKRKRPASPQISPNKKAKKGKPSGSPVSRIKADPDASIMPSNNSHYSPSTGSQSKVPSKLRDSSTASFLERSSTSSSSRSPSPGGASVGTAASSFSTQSPKIHARPIGNGKSMRGRGAAIVPPKRPSPPRPPPIHVPEYSIDVEGEGGDETGSSTDTDSS